jgi:hypothetical protein
MAPELCTFVRRKSMVVRRASIAALGLMDYVVMGSSRVGQICDDRGRWECVCLLTDKHRFEQPLSCDSSADQAGYNGAKLGRPVSPACSMKSKRTSALLQSPLPSNIHAICHHDIFSHSLHNAVIGSICEKFHGVAFLFYDWLV